MSELLPFELCVASNTLCTLQSFCSSCTYFWEKRETIAKQILTKDLTIPLEIVTETFLLKNITFYEVGRLLVDKIHFHKLHAVFRHLRYHYLKLAPFGIEYDSVFYIRKTEDNYTLLFPEQNPRVTYFFNNENYTYIKSELDARFIYQNMKFFMKKCREIAKCMVMETKSADCLIPHIKAHHPVFPSVEKLEKYQNIRVSYIEFVKIVLQNETICKWFFSQLQERNAYRATNVLSFLYFRSDYGE